MATTPDLSGNSTTDNKLTSFNRKYAGEPNGAVTPLFAGEIVLDTTNNALWKSMDLTNGAWIALTPF